MGIFGWSYPPGCSSVPGDEPVWCEVCGMCDDCCCPECPVCGEQGDPNCYKSTENGGHGMVMNEEQTASMEKELARQKAENEMWDSRAALEQHIDDEDGR